MNLCVTFIVETKERVEKVEEERYFDFLVFFEPVCISLVGALMCICLVFSSLPNDLMTMNKKKILKKRDYEARIEEREEKRVRER